MCVDVHIDVYIVVCVDVCVDVYNVDVCLCITDSRSRGYK